jgi:hypothetical protein
MAVVILVGPLHFADGLPSGLVAGMSDDEVARLLAEMGR